MNNKTVVSELKSYLKSSNAHVSFTDAIDGLELATVGMIPDGLPYSIWQLAEHIRITQWDILEFSRNPEHVSPNWPDGYWTSNSAPKSQEAWEECVSAIAAARQAFEQLLDENQDKLTVPIPHGDGQNLLKEAMLIIDHTSYHVGQIIVARRLLGVWHS